MTKTWSSELKRIAAGAVAALLIGALTGQPLAVCLLAVLAYLAFHLVQIHRLQRWLERRQLTRPPDTFGIWGDIFRDIYASQARARARSSKLTGIIERFRQAAEATPDAAVVLGANGGIEWLNQAASEQLGLRSPADVGRPIGDLLRDVELAAYLTRHRYEESIEVRSPVDAGRTLSVRVVPYGEDLRLMIARDVTRINRLENIRRDFVANVSHELRSPLTVIRGYVETMAESVDELGAQWAKPVRQMEQQVSRMCRIVDDLLTLSRLESNPDAAGNEPVRVAEMLEGIRDDARGLTNEALNIEISADAGARLAGDYNQLYSALSNLVFNAVQYTPVFKRIFLRWYVDEKGAHVEVEDEGIGIEPEHVPRLTERFYRIDKARSRAVGGTGLGLAIVKHVLARHQATLEVESVVGEGSRFTCHFPPGRIIRAEAAGGAGAV